MLSCSVVKDLLPNHVDGLVHEETAREIAAHLIECTGCRTAYEQMKHSVAPAAAQDQEDVDYLKKIRIKMKRRMLKHSILCTGAVVTLAAVFMFVFVFGTPVNSANVVYTTTIDGAGNYLFTMTLETGAALSARKEAVYTYDDSGKVQSTEIILSLYQTPELIHKGNQVFYGVGKDAFQSGILRFTLKCADKAIALTPDDF